MMESECDQQKITPHDLDDWTHAFHRGAHRERESRSPRWGCRNPFFTECFLQIAADSKDTARVADILAIDQCGWIRCELVTKRG